MKRVGESVCCGGPSGSRRTLNEFSEALNRELSLPTLRAKFIGRVERTFDLESARVFVREHAGRRLAGGSREQTFDLDDPLLKMLVNVDYLSLRDHHGAGETATGAYLIDTLGLEYLVPMTVEGEIVAVPGVGAPRRGEPPPPPDPAPPISACPPPPVALAGGAPVTPGAGQG